MIIFYKIRAFLVTWLLRLLPRTAPIVLKGPNSSLTLCEQVAVLGFNKVLIVTDNFLGSSGILDDIKSTLSDQGVDFVVYDGVSPDPSFDMVQEGQALAATERCEGVIAVGGGSVLDAAKTICLLHNNPGRLSDFDGIQKCRNPGLPLFAIPTTAGTGSEITIAAVISDPASHTKVPVVDSKMLPAYVALDAEIMKGMPPGITASTGMDALTHAIESILATSSTPATEQQARAAVRLIFRYLITAYEDGANLEARDGMAMASFYAGAAFSMTSVGYVHAIAHQFGRVCGTPHGYANAMVLPEVLEAYGECVHDRLASLAVLVGLGHASEIQSELATKFIQAIYDMRDRMDMPVTPQNLTAEHVSGIVKNAMSEAGSLYPVMRYMSVGELTTIVELKL